MSIAKYKRPLLFTMVACAILFVTTYFRRSSSLRSVLSSSSNSRPISTPTSSTMSNQTIPLSTWLQANKASFLADVNYDGAKKWTIVMGNEAGDLDSCASAIAYSYLTPHHPTIGLIQTPRADLSLRAENLAAFSLSNLSLNDLLTIDDIGVPASELRSSFALVDHNALLPTWSKDRTGENEAKVTGIVDHHEDEGKHTDASPRNITIPLGSCASLVAETFEDAFASSDANGFTPPKDLATLLLSAIYIDTGGLKPKGKGVQLDRDAATWLEAYAGHASLSGDEPPAFRKTTADDLSEKKHSVSHLSSRDLLRRDYKEYVFTTSSGESLTLGLSTVPLGTKAWLAKESGAKPGSRESLERWARERKLDIVGVLTTFKSANKGHHRRELLLMVGGGIISAPSSLSTNAKNNIDVLSQALIAGLESQSILELEHEKLKGAFADVKGEEGHEDEVVNKVRLWRQNNTDATRKVIAPIFKSIIEGLEGVKSTFEAEKEIYEKNKQM